MVWPIAECPSSSAAVEEFGFGFLPPHYHSHWMVGNRPNISRSETEQTLTENCTFHTWAGKRSDSLKFKRAVSRNEKWAKNFAKPEKFRPEKWIIVLKCYRKVDKIRNSYYAIFFCVEESLMSNARIGKKPMIYVKIHKCLKTNLKIWMENPGFWIFG